MANTLELSRRRARKAALRALYADDLAGEAPAPLAADPEETLEAGSDSEFATSIVDGVREHRDDIDSWITDAAKHWSLDRMPPVDRAILRMALYELRWMPDVPAGATINEAVELAKCFSTTESNRFVNGMLGRLAARAGRIPDSPASLQ